MNSSKLSVRKVMTNKDFCDAYEISGCEYEIGNETEDPNFIRGTVEGAKLILKLKNPPKVGDLIIFKDVPRYRNDGICIWNGTGVIDLDSEYDDYGNLPQMFRVIEPTIGKDGSSRTFPINYWHSRFQPTIKKHKHKYHIDHNNIVWFDHNNKRDEIIKNITYDDKLFPGKYALYTYFLYDDKIYYIVGTYDTITNDCRYSMSIGDSKSKLAKFDKLIKSGMTEDEALINMGYNPNKVDEKTNNLDKNILAKVMELFRLKFCSSDLIPFSSYDQEMIYDPKDERVSNTLWMIDYTYFNDQEF